jgi:hypothetical protein
MGDNWISVERTPTMTTENDFAIPSISIAGAPTIEWKFTGDVARAEIRCATAYAEMRGDGCADLRITDATSEALRAGCVSRSPVALCAGRASACHDRHA